MNIEKKKSNQIKQVFANHWFIARICFQTAPFYMLYFIFEASKRQILIFFEHAYGIRLVLETAEKGLPFSRALNYLILMMILISLAEVTAAIYEQSFSLKARPRLYKALKERLYEKAQDLDLACYDDPAYYNEFILSVSESDKTLDRFLDMLALICVSVSTMVTYGTFFVAVDKTAFYFVLASFVLNFVFTKMYNKLSYKIRLERNPFERRRAYTHRIFYLNEYAKETRLYSDVTQILYDNFNETNDEIYRINKKAAGKMWRLGFLKSYISNDFIMDGLYISYLIYQAASLHVISFSSAVVLFNSSSRLKNSFRDFSDIFPKASENNLYLQKIRDFLKYETKIVTYKNRNLPGEPKCIELKNVLFRYNEKDGNILKNISMTIRPFEKIALTGYNGAGKTTLIKLIMRLYDATEGNIYLDNVDIKEYNVNSYRKYFGAVFQDYRQYAASIRENVMMDYPKDKSERERRDQKVIAALVESGFKKRLETLKQGLDTELTMEFKEDGINLSGGESQKIAIARVFYEDSNIIILDEPSSALDPIAEYNLNKAMNKAAKNKTVLYISHRLSTTRDADRIYMMENGTIVENGTHDELLNLSGKYAKMWYSQAGWYQSAENNI